MKTFGKTPPVNGDICRKIRWYADIGLLGDTDIPGDA